MLYQICAALGVPTSAIVGHTRSDAGDIRVVYTTPNLDVVVRHLERNAAGVLRPVGPAEPVCAACDLEHADDEEAA